MPTRTGLRADLLTIALTEQIVASEALESGAKLLGSISDTRLM